MQKKGVMDIVTYILLGLALVAILTHASGFASAVSSLGGIVTSESQILSGRTVSQNKG